MKRLCLVLFVCLSVQLNAASAPFLHVHAGEAHRTDHQDGSVVHRHLTQHTTTGGHHHTAEIPLDSEAADAPSAIESSDTAAPLAVGALTARLSPAGTSTAAPTGVATVFVLPRPAIPPDDDVGDSLPDSPDPRSSSHRGPPR